MLALCAIDNLAKGASGGAVQAANVALGLDETAGLTSRALPVTADLGCPPIDRRTGRTGSRRTEAGRALVEALPYIRRFAGRSVVVKYGGNALAGAHARTTPSALFAEDIVLMRQVGMRPVVVHGGGPQISDLMTRLGKVAEFRDGLRVTDAETVDIARMVLIGQVNPQLVAAINVHGPLAVGVSRRGRRADPGHGRATRGSASSATSSRSTRRSCSACSTTGSSPSSPPSAPTHTGQAYNINADTVAGAIAEALGAEKLVYLTDIEGLRRQVDDPASLHPPDDARRARRADGRRHDRRRDDPEDRQLRPGRAQRRAPGAHPRRPHPPRAAARDLHRRGDRHDGARGGTT